jgi:very-short-patch-repair endonuclease
VPDHEVRAALAAIGRRQHALVERRQALEAGLSERALSRMVADGQLERVMPRVYRFAGAPTGWPQPALAAVLSAGSGAVASHATAAFLWGLLDDPPDLPEVSVARPRAPEGAGYLLHRSRDLRPEHGSVRDRVPVTNPLRTLVDLGAVLRPWQVEAALDAGLEKRLFTVAAVAAFRSTVARPGRRGSGVLGEILDYRALGTRRPDSRLEPCMARLIRDHGVPTPVFQHEVRTPTGRFVARVDFAYPDLLLAVEVDGFEKRATPASLQHDLDRQNALVELGWTVLRYTWLDVVRQPEKVASSLLRQLARRSGQGSGR